MASNAGYIGKGNRNITGNARKYVKSSTSKRRRRLGRKLLDDTPKVVTKGWAD